MDAINLEELFEMFLNEHFGDDNPDEQIIPTWWTWVSIILCLSQLFTHPNTLQYIIIDAKYANPYWLKDDFENNIKKKQNSRIFISISTTYNYELFYEMISLDSLILVNTFDMNEDSDLEVIDEYDNDDISIHHSR